LRQRGHFWWQAFLDPFEGLPHQLLAVTVLRMLVGGDDLKVDLVR